MNSPFAHETQMRQVTLSPALHMTELRCAEAESAPNE